MKSHLVASSIKANYPYLAVHTHTHTKTIRPRSPSTTLSPGEPGKDGKNLKRWLSSLILLFLLYIFDNHWSGLLLMDDNGYNICSSYNLRASNIYICVNSLNATFFYYKICCWKYFLIIFFSYQVCVLCYFPGQFDNPPKIDNHIFSHQGCIYTSIRQPRVSIYI